MAHEAMAQIMLDRLKELVATMEKAQDEVKRIDRENNVSVDDPVTAMCARVRAVKGESLPEIKSMSNQELLVYMGQNPEKFRT